MQKLLHIEWLKLKNYRTFWILIALYVILLPLFNYQVANGMGSFTANGVSIFNKSYSFPGVWDNMGYFGSYFITLLAILVIILNTNEYTFRTNRQNIIDGWQRVDFLNAKVLVVLILSVLATLFFFILGSCFGLAYGGAISELFNNCDKIFYFFLLSVNYLAFAMMIALLIKRSGLAISLFLLYAIIVENLVHWILNLGHGNIGNFLPLQSSDELLPFPVIKMAQNMGMMGASAVIPMQYYVVATVAWCLVYYFICRSVLLRRDW